MPNSFVTPWTVASQVPLSMEFSRQEYWSELPFPTPGDQIYVSGVSCIGRQNFTTGSPGKPTKTWMQNVLGTSLTVQYLTLHFQCRGHTFHPWSGNKDSICWQCDWKKNFFFKAKCFKWRTELLWRKNIILDLNFIGYVMGNTVGGKTDKKELSRRQHWNI